MYLSVSRLPRWVTLRAALIVPSALALAVPSDAVPVVASPTPGIPAADGTATTPVVDVIAPVLDIVTATSDLGGVVTDKESSAQVTLVLDATVLFAKDSATLAPRARSVLTGVVRRLEQAGPGSVRIVGYTDDLGTAQHGLALSGQRADAVAGFLRPPLPTTDYPFTVEGKGEADFVAPNTSEANRRKNRRVEITVIRSR